MATNAEVQDKTGENIKAAGEVGMHDRYSAGGIRMNWMAVA